jgi:hypothetical protein
MTRNDLRSQPCHSAAIHSTWRAGEFEGHPRVRVRSNGTRLRRRLPRQLQFPAPFVCTFSCKLELNRKLARNPAPRPRAYAYVCPLTTFKVS